LRERVVHLHYFELGQLLFLGALGDKQARDHLLDLRPYYLNGGQLTFPVIKDASKKLEVLSRGQPKASTWKLCRTTMKQRRRDA
jgi:hypothetical protein